MIQFQKVGKVWTYGVPWARPQTLETGNGTQCRHAPIDHLSSLIRMVLYNSFTSKASYPLYKVLTCMLAISKPLKSV